jgi:AraC-like DNA-binding protein
MNRIPEQGRQGGRGRAAKPGGPPAKAAPAPLLRRFFAPPVAVGDELEIAGVGVREWMPPGVVDRRHGTGDWLMMVFHHAVTVGVEGGRQEAPPGTLMIWSPGMAQFYGCAQGGPEGGTWLHSWIHAQGPGLERLVRGEELPCGRPLAGVDPAWIERAALDVHQEVAAHAVPDAVIVGNCLHTFLRQARRARIPAGRAAPPALIAVRRHIEEHFAEPFSLAELARRAGLSPNHFCSAFRRHFAVAPIDHLIRLRLERARELLRDRSLSIAAVARAVGYADAHYFAKLCRRRLGCAPSALR